MTHGWKHWSFVVLGVVAIVAGSACKAGSPAAPTTPPRLLTQEEVHNFAAELARSLAFAATDCFNRGFRANTLGTSPVNLTCTSTRPCSIGGTIRPSMTATGQLFTSTTRVTMNLSLSGSQNILDWGCVVNPWIVSGNPTVSLSGSLTADSAANPVGSYSMRQSGQIIYGPRGGGQRSCALNFLTITDTNAAANSARIVGSMCDTTFDRNIVL